MFDMDQFMADREAAMRPRMLSAEERDVYNSGAPECECEDDDDCECYGY